MRLLTLLLICTFFFFFSFAYSAESDNETDSVVTREINGTVVESNATSAKPREDSFADMIDRALEKEFPDNDQNEVPDPGSFNNSVADQQAVLETVARVKPKKNETKTKEEKSFFNLDNENGVEDTPRLIDRKDNVFIMSNPKSKYPVLQLDLRLISDLVVVIVSATCGGIAFACAGQPVITGYLLAGSIIGPGGLSFVSEMVQVAYISFSTSKFIFFFFSSYTFVCFHDYQIAWDKGLIYNFFV
jgi:hypothetical protein